jgi:DNA-directed RNA polymerase specialized sigma24 family protein
MRIREATLSFEEFVQARSGSLMRTALLLAGQNRAEAEDLLQLALERAYRHWTRACGSGEPERYVRRILANASADRWRRLARRPEQALPPGEAGLARLRDAADPLAASPSSRTGGPTVTDIERRIRAAMHAGVDGEEAPDDLLARVRQRHRRHLILMSGATVIAVAAIMVVPAVLASRGGDGAPAAGTSSRRTSPPGPASPVATASPSPAHPGRSQPQRHEPSKLIGLRLPHGRVRLLLAGPQPAWFAAAPRTTRVIANLPRTAGGYSLARVAGGWTASAYSAGPGCPPACAGPVVPVYFIADGAAVATRVGTGYAVGPAAGRGMVWLMRYRRISEVPGTSSATARQVSITGQPAGPPLGLPVGYVIQRGVGSDLLLVPVSQGPESVYELWDPATRRVVRTFGNVTASSPSQIAWTQTCENCAVHVLDLTTGTTATIQVPRGSWAYDGSFSGDGRLLAVHLSAGVTAGQASRARIAVIDLRGRRVLAVPGSTVGVDIPAVLGIGWQVGGHRLIVTLSGAGQFVQVAYWQPGAAHLRVATIRIPRGMSPAVDASG